MPPRMHRLLQFNKQHRKEGQNGEPGPTFSFLKIFERKGKFLVLFFLPVCLKVPAKTSEQPLQEFPVDDRHPAQLLALSQIGKVMKMTQKRHRSKLPNMFLYSITLPMFPAAPQQLQRFFLFLKESLKRLRMASEGEGKSPVCSPSTLFAQNPCWR